MWASSRTPRVPRRLHEHDARLVTWPDISVRISFQPSPLYERFDETQSAGTVGHVLALGCEHSKNNFNLGPGELA